MRCSEVQLLFSQYIDDTLPEDQHDSLVEHLKGCVVCRSEIELMRRIEAIASQNLYKEPVDDYWDQTPAKIVSRLNKGLHAQPRKTFGRLLNPVLAMPRLRFGLALLVVALLGTLIVNRFKVEKTPQTTQLPDSVQPQAIENEMVFENETGQEHTPESPEMIVSGVGMEDIKGNQPITVSADAKPIMPIPSVTEMAIRREYLFVTRQIRIGSLIPSVIVAWPLPGEEELLDDERLERERSTYGALALQQSGMVLSAPVPEEETPQDLDLESSFNEAMWIVQQSTSLEEKRNIWLSYINRETNETYRSLGVYHLALVLAEIAEQDRDPDIALAAEEFYHEHEQILKQLMGDSRFNRKVVTFSAIIRTL